MKSAEMRRTIGLARVIIEPAIPMTRFAEREPSARFMAGPMRISGELSVQIGGRSATGASMRPVKAPNEEVFRAITARVERAVSQIDSGKPLQARFTLRALLAILPPARERNREAAGQ